MACRRLVELPKVSFQRFYIQPIKGSCSTTSFEFNRKVALATSHCRCASSHPIQEAPAVPEINPNIYYKIRKKLGLPDYSKSFYNAIGLFIYEKIDNIEISEFIKEFELEDTFYSWYLFVELHLWMLLSRASQHEREGLYVKESLGTTMWNDIRRRIKLVDPNMSLSYQKDTLNDLDAQMQFAIVLYDEAVTSDDKRLAEALWVRLYQGKPVDPILLEKAVCYVRKQIRHLDLTPREEFILKANFTWLPLRKCRV